MALRHCRAARPPKNGCLPAAHAAKPPVPLGRAAGSDAPCIEGGPTLWDRRRASPQGLTDKDTLNEGHARREHPLRWRRRFNGRRSAYEPAHCMAPRPDQSVALAGAIKRPRRSTGCIALRARTPRPPRGASHRRRRRAGAAGGDEAGRGAGARGAGRRRSCPAALPLAAQDGKGRRRPATRGAGRPATTMMESGNTSIPGLPRAARLGGERVVAALAKPLCWERPRRKVCHQGQWPTP